MTASLDMFQLVAATKQERDEASSRDDPVKVFRAAWQALAQIDADATRAQEATKRAQKIAARLDDPNLHGTKEQRIAAESAHYSCTWEAKRLTKEEIPRVARDLLRLWPKLAADDRDWFCNVFVKGWNTSPAWMVLDRDPVLSKNKVIAELIRLASIAVVEEPPF